MLSLTKIAGSLHWGALFMRRIFCRIISPCLALYALAGALPSGAANEAVVIPWDGDDFLVIPLPGAECLDPGPDK